VLTEQLSHYDAYIETDYSRFDRTVSLPILRDVQDYIFTQCNSEPDFVNALILARSTRGSSSLGVSYEVEGTRCSGDAHTSVGNGLINAFITYACLKMLPSDSWTSVHEGDDGIIGVSAEHRYHALSALTFIPFLGFHVKQDVYNQMDDVSFCGRHYYSTPEGFKDHADVLRSLAKFHTTVSNCKALPLIRAKAMSYYSTDSCTPLIGPLCHALIIATRDVSFSALKRASRADQRWITQGHSYDFNAPCPLRPITIEARLSVYRRTGITPGEQVWYESQYLAMAKQEKILVMPRIPHEWTIRDDGFVYGIVSDWVRSY